MIQRIVLIKLNEAHSNDAARAEATAHSREALTKIPGVMSVTVGAQVEPIGARRWDLALTITFECLDDVEVYRVDPLHRAYVDDFLKPRLEIIKAWNFEI